MGRTRQFDEAEVLTKAMLSFWKNGYEKTTVRNLESDMGINQFSIYASFKNKQELYKRVLQNYRAQLNNEFLKDLLNRDCTLKEVKDFLKSFALSIVKGKVPNSCLMVNSLSEMERFDPNIRQIIMDFFEAMKNHFVRALNNSLLQGNLNKDKSIDQCAEYLLGIAQSISIYSKIKSPKKIIQYVDFSIDLLKP